MTTGEPSYTEAEIRSAARALWKSEDNVGEYWVVGLLRVLALQRSAEEASDEHR